MSAEADSYTPPPPSDDHYRLVCEHAAVALVATDTDLRIQTWNSAARRIFGASGAQMIGTSVLSVVPAPCRAEAEQLLNQAISDHLVGQFEFSQRDSTGDLRTFAVAVSPIVDDEGATLGASTWVRDITTRTRLLEEVMHGRKMRALGEMAGALAHYFNNILGGIVTSVDFALAQEDAQAGRRALEQTARSLNRATRLVENLLVFAEGDHRHSDLGDLTEVLLQAIEIVEPELAAAGVDLELDLQAVAVTAVPREPILTLIFNLVHNAVDAMPGGGKLVIRLRPGERGCVLSVSDTGRGIPEDLLERIFEPFFSTKAAGEDCDERAVGFGLAVAHRIIEELGGRICVSSEEEKGSSFDVHLPLPAAT